MGGGSLEYYFQFLFKNHYGLFGISVKCCSLCIILLINEAKNINKRRDRTSGNLAVAAATSVQGMWLKLKMPQLHFEEKGEILVLSQAKYSSIHQINYFTKNLTNLKAENNNQIPKRQKKSQFATVQLIFQKSSSWFFHRSRRVKTWFSIFLAAKYKLRNTA